MSAHPWFRFFPDNWLTGTMDLTLEEEAAYLRVVALIYAKAGPIPDNDRWLAGTCRVSTRKWRVLKSRLVEAGKITIEGGWITNSRAEKELRKRAQKSAKSKRAVEIREKKESRSDGARC